MSGIIVLILRILLAAALYGFLGWALFTLWSDLRQRGLALSAPQIPAITLTRIPATGQPEPIDAPKTFTKPEVIIGRSNRSEEVIPDETVSARHARLSFHHNQWWLQDLGSTNGTFLNDERVKLPTVIASGDELRVGHISLLIEIGQTEG